MRLQDEPGTGGDQFINRWRSGGGIVAAVARFGIVALQDRLADFDGAEASRFAAAKFGAEAWLAEPQRDQDHSQFFFGEVVKGHTQAEGAAGSARFKREVAFGEVAVYIE
ncbi:MAG: hypothetical protein D6735_06800, partial [Acidobacteria bacterium]